MGSKRLTGKAFMQSSGARSFTMPNGVRIMDLNKGTGKIPNVSLTPGAGCPFTNIPWKIYDRITLGDALLSELTCIKRLEGLKSVPPCHKECYGARPYCLFSNTRRAWDSNLKIAFESPEKFAMDILCYCRKYRPELFRLFVSGDFFSRELCKVIVGMSATSDTRFLAYTKNHKLLHLPRPENLVMFASMWPEWGDYDKVKGLAPVVFMRDQKGKEDRIPSNAHECAKNTGGHCDSCGWCWYAKVGDVLVINEH